jgi:transcriptional regulator with XRE-family HTH domain
MKHANEIPERYALRALRLQVHMSQKELGVRAGYFECTCRAFEDSQKFLSDAERQEMVAMLNVLLSLPADYSRLVREWRSFYALTITEAGAQLGIPRATVHALECGDYKRLPMRGTREKLDRFFGLATA